MESALNVYYMGMAVYGWWQWHKPATDQTAPANSHAVTVHRWRWQQHVIALSMIAVATLVSGTLLARNTEAALPYLDSFTTWSSVVTTFMVARKVLENWWYWIVIDAVSVYLYIDRGLYLTAMLFISYTVIAIFGYFAWQRTMKTQQHLTPQPASA